MLPLNNTSNVRLPPCLPRVGYELYIYVPTPWITQKVNLVFSIFCRGGSFLFCVLIRGWFFDPGPPAPSKIIESLFSRYLLLVAFLSFLSYIRLQNHYHSVTSILQYNIKMQLPATVLFRHMAKELLLLLTALLRPFFTLHDISL
jgi:hypothetical protein